LIAPAPLILASASPRREELLRSLGLEFRVVPGDAEELHDEKLGAEEVCRINAEIKAGAVARRHPEATVLGADTLVARNGRIYGKPRDLEEARQMLAELAGGEHEVTTGVCLVHLARGRSEVFSDRTVVRFKPLSTAAIEEYIRLVPVLDKAGAYGIQERGEMLVESICGSFTNVMGLPAERLSDVLRRWGYSPRIR
jgi:septum formation protein